MSGPLDGVDVTDAAGLLSRCLAPLIWATGFYLLINILMLASSLYMMQVYDRVMRQLVQVALLGTGAWLLVRHEMGAGSMMASSLVVRRALSPVEQAIGG